MKTLNLVHIYPKEMNIYGDNGNVLIIKKRLDWQGYNVKICNVGVGDELPKDTFMIIGGGGQDSGQTNITDDLIKKANDLKKMAKSGVPMLMICGMYQMFGHYFKTNQGEKLPGIGLLDIYTIASHKRVIGNIISNTEWGKIVGYENHSGLTYLGNKVKPFGHTIKNQGNNGVDLTEGARQYNVFGSYMHGPLLSKNPELADYLIAQGLKRYKIKYNPELLKIDKLAWQAREMAQKRPR